MPSQDTNHQSLSDSASQDFRQSKRRDVSLLSAVVIVFVVLLALTAGVVYALQQNRVNKLQAQVSSLKAQQCKDRNTLASSIQSDKFQAVFVNTPGATGGQAYFGHLSILDNNNYRLTDVYYISSNGGSLVKLGNEVHKPQDAMFIPKSSVIFWENLQDAHQFGGMLK